MTIQPFRRILANPDIVYREEADGAFLFDPETGDLKCLNPMGGAIWRLCDGSLFFEDIKQRLTERYSDVSKDLVHEDISAFFEELFGMGYLGYELEETTER